MHDVQQYSGNETEQPCFGFDWEPMDSDLQRSLKKEPYRVFQIFKDVSYFKFFSLFDILRFTENGEQDQTKMEKEKEKKGGEGVYSLLNKNSEQSPLSVAAFSFCAQVQPAGGSAQKPSPAYHTPRLPVYRQRFHLPGPFQLYPGGNVERSGRKPADVPPRTPISQVRYRGWEGIFGMRAEATIYEPRAFVFRNSIDSTNERLRDDMENCASQSYRVKSFTTITRQGVGRTYRLEIKGYDAVTHHPATKTLYWKGSKSALSLVEDQKPRCNGNLKLVSADRPDNVLAVWQNRTDRRIMGSLSIIDNIDEGEAGLLEEVITSCLTVVMAERISGRGWVGGLCKSRKSKKSKS